MGKSPSPSPSVRDAITSGARTWKQDPKVMLAFAQVESSFNPAPKPSDEKESTGLFQIRRETWAGLVKDKLITGDYSTNPAEQSRAAAALVSQLTTEMNGDMKAVAVAYNAGPKAGLRFKALVAQGWSDVEANKQAVLEAGRGDPSYIVKWTKAAGMQASTGGTHTAGSNTSEASSTSQTVTEGPPSDYVPLVSDSVEASIVTEGNTRSLFIDEGLDSLPWYEDQDLLVGNPHLKKLQYPVTFSINLKEFASPLMATKDSPLTVKLNCSLDSETINMKHIINKSNTRTGFHMTFWGMEPDTITGSGSTGVFMNQFGVTDLMSLAVTPDELFDAAEEAGQGAPLLNTPRNSRLRVAAQDAFVELLSLFRNNGITRYKRDNYEDGDSVTINRDQIQQSVWSEKYGDTSYTRNARNNDVMVKGNVVMKFKSNYYHGYFKSLSWTMDAENPFQWKFDFTFQVQKTVSFVFYPRA
jgi:hypothetical protein